MGSAGGTRGRARPFRLPDAAGELARRLARRAIGPRAVDDRALIASIQDMQEHLAGVEVRLAESQRELDGRLGALESKLSHVVAGIELGSVPARETTYLGHPFVYPYDSAIGDLIDAGCEWDALLRPILSELVTKDEPVIWEVGSNIGASLRQMLLAKPGARVLAFEPSGRFRPFLERNIELARLGRVEVLPFFIGRTSGASEWLYESGTTAGVVADSNDAIHKTTFPGFEPHGRQRVRITTLDEVRADHESVDFLKIDTDGFDFEVLRGGEEMLQRDRPVLYFELLPGLAELVPSPVAEGLSWLRDAGYGWLACFNPAGHLIGKTDDPAQAVEWAEANVYCDVLACFEGSVSKARLAGIELALQAVPVAVSSSAA